MVRGQRLLLVVRGVLLLWCRQGVLQPPQLHRVCHCCGPHGVQRLLQLLHRCHLMLQLCCAGGLRLLAGRAR
jgi:hypothetical protein